MGAEWSPSFSPCRTLRALEAWSCHTLQTQTTPLAWAGISSLASTMCSLLDLRGQVWPTARSVA